MRLEFFTGLLLVLALLAVLVFIFKEFLSTTQLNFSKASLSDAPGRQRSTEPAPINAHLVGMSGEVVRVNDNGERPMTVRLGSELWPARLDTAESAGGEAQGRSSNAESPGGDADHPSVGAHVVVTAVEGPVVLVVAAD